MELRDGLRHPEGDRDQRRRKTERALRRSAGRRARTLRAEVFPLNVPINPGPGFNQVLDVLRNEMVMSDGRRGNFARAGDRRMERPRRGVASRVIELIAESDDTLLKKFFDGGGLREEEFRAGFTRQCSAVLSRCSARRPDEHGRRASARFHREIGSSPGGPREGPRGRRAQRRPNGSRNLGDTEPVLQVFRR